jgi:hypothetical protein
VAGDVVALTARVTSSLLGCAESARAGVLGGVMAVCDSVSALCVVLLVVPVVAAADLTVNAVDVDALLLLEAAALSTASGSVLLATTSTDARVVGATRTSGASGRVLLQTFDSNAVRSNMSMRTTKQTHRSRTCWQQCYQHVLQCSLGTVVTKWSDTILRNKRSDHAHTGTVGYAPALPARRVDITALAHSSSHCTRKHVSPTQTRWLLEALTLSHTRAFHSRAKTCRSRHSATPPT